jgi:PAS domain S-box-containing protein
MKIRRATAEEPGFVSGRFLSDFFSALERSGVPITQLLGDLPIPIGAAGEVTAPVEWNHFADFMARLERHVEGPDGLEACGEMICDLKPASMLRSLAGFSTSPYLLYRAASLWALRRTMPGIETLIEQVGPDRIEIRVALAPGLKACPQIFYFAVGGARALPRILDMRDAVVAAEIGDREAFYRIASPPSRTLFARIKRVSRAVFSAGSVLQFLEAQQLELHAKHEALQKTNEALAESELRYRTITDTAVDVLCEIDQNGRIGYVSASIQDLMGYSPEQVTGSHFRLWLPTEFREIATERFKDFASQPPGLSASWERVALHNEAGGRTIAELSLRSYETPKGEWRMVGILRDRTERYEKIGDKPKPRPVRAERQPWPTTSSTIARLMSQSDETPIARSLAVLLAAVESKLPDPDSPAANRIVEATRRMTQIVESAIVQTPEASLDFEWIETRKLIDLVRSGFLANPRNSAISELRVEVANAPREIWGDIDLLTVGLGSLLDWAAHSATEAGSIELRTDALRSPAGDGVNENAVIFAVSAQADGSNLDAQRPEARNDDEGRDSPELDLAIAEDAIRALGGEIVTSADSPQRAVGQIRLVSQSASRTMSAPSA